MGSYTKASPGGASLINSLRGPAGSVDKLWAANISAVLPVHYFKYSRLDRTSLLAARSDGEFF